MIHFSLALILTTSVLFLGCGWLLRQTASRRRLAAAVIWGMAAFGITFSLHETLLAGQILNENSLRLASAPLVEELLKALPLLLLARRLRTAQNGALYGFGIGLGFATVESLVYVIAAPTAALGTAATRIITINLLHGMTTALVGILSARDCRIQPTALSLVAAVTLAIFTHASFNFLTQLLVEIRLWVALAFSLGGGTLLFTLLQRLPQPDFHALGHTQRPAPTQLPL
ncbi:MAG TPA: PrsW family glutamic-type intramembrane protease [Phototrophicaceae bacterium]|nr:PrsW family glutamic-type intramembrane protease [Phototrophicaceae bacterium]